MNLDRCVPLRAAQASATQLPISTSASAQLLRAMIELFVARAYRVETVRLRPEFQRRRNAALPWKIVMYLLHIAGGFSLTEIARLYARDRKTVSLACAAVEDARDEPGLDRVLSLLEQAMDACCRRPSTDAARL